jgi:hypothetical protein
VRQAEPGERDRGRRAEDAHLEGGRMQLLDRQQWDRHGADLAAELGRGLPGSSSRKSA